MMTIQQSKGRFGTVIIIALFWAMHSPWLLFAESTHYGMHEEYELWEPPVNAIHIDPTNQGDPDADGSLAHPYDSFHASGFPWFEGAIYALKRGTVMTDSIVEIRSAGVTICSYGESTERPKFYCTSETVTGQNMHAFFTWDSSRFDITIRDIEIEAPLASSCIRLMNGANVEGIRIINCKLHGSIWGLRLLFTANVLVDNVEVYNTADDGMFIQGVSNLEIKNCHVHHVNTNWQPPSTPESEAGGDGIQLDNCNYWHVHHNYLDRTSSGNKFCFISNNPNQTDGILEHNYMTGPLVDGLSIYLHNGNGIIVRYNFIKGPSGRPLYSHGTNIKIYGNVMTGISGPIYTSQSSNIYNNIFHNMDGAIQGGTITARNNIFMMSDGAEPFGWVSNLTEENNFSTGDPLFIDPAADNFMLQPVSPCKDLSIIPMITTDIAEVQVPQGSNPDIGPYEN